MVILLQDGMHVKIGGVQEAIAQKASQPLIR